MMILLMILTLGIIVVVNGYELSIGRLYHRTMILQKRKMGRKQNMNVDGFSSMMSYSSSMKISSLLLSSSSSFNWQEENEYSNDSDDNDNDNNDDGNNNVVGYRSVSDYMGGWHAGEFDFDTRISGVTSLNYEKSIINFDGYESNNYNYNENQKYMYKGNHLAMIPNDTTGTTMFENDGTSSTTQDNTTSSTRSTMKPKWAYRSVAEQLETMAIISSTVDGKKQNNNHSLILDLTNPPTKSSFSGTVQIVNEELSWEPFYVTIETESGDILSENDYEYFSVFPSQGSLAPRGGADRYTDTCEITVTLNESTSDFSQLFQKGIYLVIRTELDAWVWKIVKGK